MGGTGRTCFVQCAVFWRWSSLLLLPLVEEALEERLCRYDEEE
jgi:hypothetical protein